MRALRGFVGLGAFLMFWAESLVGRLVLPSYGGSYQVWVTCLLFFQTALLAGYLYAHTVLPRLGRAHVVVLLLPALTFPLGVAAALGEPNVGGLLLGLVWGAGPALAVLSTASVSAQVLLASRPNGGAPWSLYAWSNAGSLAGLLAFPLLIEPTVGLFAQRVAWSLGYVAWALGGLYVFRDLGATSAPRVERAEVWQSVRWAVPALATSALLSGVSARILMEVGALPLVWVLPLAAYLLSYSLAFSDRALPGWLDRYAVELGLLGLAVPFFGKLPGGAALVVHLALLFGTCWVVHRDLYDRRPHAGQLTWFYLMLSLGGVLGGALTALVAPAVFVDLTEYPLAMALALGVIVAARGSRLRERARTEPALLGATGVLATCVLAVVLVGGLGEPGLRYQLRDFYGIYRVIDVDDWEGAPARVIVSGNTVHGRQVLGPEASEPIGYYHRAAPLGQAIAVVEAPRNAAVVGLGAGALALHFGAGETVVFHELDPANEGLARTWFTYLASSGAAVSVVPGDARLTLRDVPEASLDILVIDAFSSDTIPTHLLTAEAIAMYLEKLAPDAVLVFHISNRYFDLRPLLTRQALDLGVAGAWQVKQAGLQRFEEPSIAFAIARRPERLAPLVAAGWTGTASGALPAWPAWTDDHANVLLPMWQRVQLAREPITAPRPPRGER